jgi:hypothetical protein
MLFVLLVLAISDVVFVVSKVADVKPKRHHPATAWHLLLHTSLDKIFLQLLNGE